jgi:hypothetical protein
VTVATSSVNRAPRPSSLTDVLDVVLDKGIVIDAYVRVAVVGIELLTIDARIVVASVDTYLRFAEAVNRLDLQPQGQVGGLPGMVQEMNQGAGKQRTKGALQGAKETASDFVHSIAGGDEEEEQETSPSRQDRSAPQSRRAPSRSGG